MRAAARPDPAVNRCASLVGWRRWAGGLLVAVSLAMGSGCAVQTAALRAHPPAELPRAAELVDTPFHPQTALQCGPAALATALGAIARPVAPETLAEQVFLPARGGSLQTEMVSGARRHGALATRIPGTLDAVVREVAAGHVVVVLLNLSVPLVPVWHYAVVVGYDLAAGTVTLRSGGTARDVLALRTFEHTWSRSGFWAMVVVPPGQWPATAELPAAVEAAVGFERSASAAQAQAVYAAGLQRWPDSLPMAIGLGTSTEAVGDRPGALAVFRRAAAQHDSGAAWLNLAQLLREEGRLVEAQTAARRALSDRLWAAQAQRWLAEPSPAPIAPAASSSPPTAPFTAPPTAP